LRVLCQAPIAIKSVEFLRLKKLGKNVDEIDPRSVVFALGVITLVRFEED
jgi:hypothetical protein